MNEIILRDIKQFTSLNYFEFIQYYDTALILYLEYIITGKEDALGYMTESRLTYELDFIKEVQSHLMDLNRLYRNEMQELENDYNMEHVSLITGMNKKFIYIQHKALSLGVEIHIIEGYVQLQTLSKAVKAERSAVKAFNVLEKYKICDELFGIGANISKLKLTQDKKNEILSMLMGIHKDTAKDLLNGTYSKKVQPDMERVNEYINSIKHV